MSKQIREIQQENLNLSDSLFFEFVDHLFKPQSGKIWLQKTVNLLKQLLNANNIILHSHADNLVTIASDDLIFTNTKIMPLLNRTNSNAEPCWLEQFYFIPLLLEGQLIIDWGKTLTKNETKNYNVLFSLLSNSLKIRDDLLSIKCNISEDQNFLNFQEILTSDSNLKQQVSLVTKEITLFLNASRCQIKLFSNNLENVFNNSLSAEFANDGFLEAISVIPSVEQEWLNKLSHGEFLILDKKQNSFEKNIESLLSIKAILGIPLVYKNKSIGVLVLHQCDYERIWKVEEISYINNIALMLSLALGKELEISDKNKSDSIDIETGLIDSNKFLRELSHTQIDAKTRDLPFSLILIDIEKLKDINLKMGFVAGNLVLSQTARYIKRLYGDIYKIARYNNDEFVIILNNADHHKARIETEKLKEYLSNVSVFGIGTIEYNFSFVTFPTHTDSIAELLTLMEQAMILSKSRGKFQISSFDEIKDLPKNNWQQLITYAIPEIILKKSNLKTGPDIIENINKQIIDFTKKKTYSADILDSVQSLALALDAKDSYTEGHSKRVSEYAYLLAKELDLDLHEIEWIRLAAILHDIGKIGIPENILCKPEKLTKEEYETMKKHPVIGAKILKPIKPLEKVATLVLYHHEYWDGSGYPNGLSKNDIPTGARIVSIVDAYQAMTSNRPYRSSLSFEEAIKRLKEGKEKQWDPELVDLFIKIVS